MKLLIELDEEYVKVIDEIKFLVGGRTNRKLQLEIIKAIKNGIPLEQEPTTKNDLSSELEKNSKKLEKKFGELDCISRADAIKAMQDKAKKLKNEDTINGLCGAVAILFNLPSVTPQEPRCKNCKWWKDSDGEYRRGCGAESQCPINRREVFEGNGYCFLFEPQGSEE